jgi:predicted acetyltransferase
VGNVWGGEIAEAFAADVKRLAVVEDSGYTVREIVHRHHASDAAEGDLSVRRYYPAYPAIYARLGWTMFQSIDRVYDSGKAARRLGFTCRTGFGERLRELERRLTGHCS